LLVGPEEVQGLVLPEGVGGGVDVAVELLADLVA